MLNEIKKELETQDNLSTADPIFVVYDWDKIPTSSDYSDKSFYCSEDGEIGETRESVYEWLENNGSENIPKDLKDLSNYNFDSWIEDQEGIRKVYYKKVRRFINVFFTRKAAQEHIDQNHYHYSKEVHIYVNSLWRNPEVVFIRNGLLNGDFVLKQKNVLVVENERNKI